MRQIINFVIIVLVLLFSGCRIKRVRNIKTENKLLLNFFDEFDYLGSTRFYLPEKPTEQQRKYFYSIIESNFFKLKAAKYIDFEYQRQRYFQAIKKQKKYNINEFRAIKKLLDDQDSKVHYFLIRRIDRGLVYDELIVSVVVLKNEVKAVFSYVISRYFLKEILRNDLFYYVFLKKSVIDYLVLKDVELFLEKYLNLEKLIKIHGMTDELEEQYFKLGRIYEAWRRYD